MLFLLLRSKLSELHGNMFIEKCDRCETEYIRRDAVTTVGLKRTGGMCERKGIRGQCRYSSYLHTFTVKNPRMRNYIFLISVSGCENSKSVWWLVAGISLLVCSQWNLTWLWQHDGLQNIIFIANK